MCKIKLISLHVWNKLFSVLHCSSEKNICSVCTDKQSYSKLKALWFRRGLLSPKGIVSNFIGTLIVGTAKTVNYFKWYIPPSKFIQNCILIVASIYNTTVCVLL